MLPDALRPYASADIYLVDQILRGNIQPGMRVLDVACGAGRNSVALLELGCKVTGIDFNPQAITACQQQFGDHPNCEQLLVQDVSEMCFEEKFDAVIVNALFHFASDHIHFREWADLCWDQVANRGLFWARLSTTLAIPEARPFGFTFLANLDDLERCEQSWGARRSDPLKTTAVEDQRCMTTWVLKKD